MAEFEFTGANNEARDPATNDPKKDHGETIPVLENANLKPTEDNNSIRIINRDGRPDIPRNNGWQDVRILDYEFWSCLTLTSSRIECQTVHDTPLFRGIAATAPRIWAQTYARSALSRVS